MKRPFLLPASAALLGILMALGVFALKRVAQSALSEGHFYTDVQVRAGAELAELAELEEILVEVEGARVEAAAARSVMDRVRAELRASLETEQNLTQAERERVMEALQRLDDRLNLDLGVAEIRIRSTVEVPDPPAPEAPAAPEATPAPSGTGTGGGN